MNVATKNSQLKEWDRSFVWHAFTQMSDYVPLIAERAEGSCFFDIDGKRYVDGCSSLWCNVHGHRHPQIDQAIRNQLDRVAHVTNLGMSSDVSIELAKRLVEITPQGLNHVFFACDGASATEVALKMAFQYWHQKENSQTRQKFIAMSNGYHGDTIGSTSLGGVQRFHELFRPLLFETIHISAPDRFRIPTGMSEPEYLQSCLSDLRKQLESNRGEIAAVVLEPLVQGAAGMLMHVPGFLSGALELTKEFDTLLIADEVAVGFGRTGTLFACEQEHVSPDILCLGKGLSGGYLPVSATLATTEIWNEFLAPHAESKTFFHGHTYGGNPLGAAASIANLNVFDEEKTLEKLPTKIQQIEKRLQRLNTFQIAGTPRQTGMMSAFDLLSPNSSKPLPWELNAGTEFCKLVIERGVWLRPLGNTIIIMPPLSISESEINTIFDAIEDALNVFSPHD